MPAAQGSRVTALRVRLEEKASVRSCRAAELRLLVLLAGQLERGGTSRVWPRAGSGCQWALSHGFGCWVR